MGFRFVLLILLAALGLSGCRATQRVDLASNGYVDALACVTNRGGDAASATKGCDTRLFAYSGPSYKQGFLEGTACARAKGGSAESAAQACQGAGPSA